MVRLLGPFPKEMSGGIQLNLFWVIPKKLRIPGV